MHDANPSNSEIRCEILRLAPALLTRYGRFSDCTRGQLEKTFAELSVSEAVRPYLSAAFAAPAELKAIEASAPATVWVEVENRTKRIIEGLLPGASGNGAFYESGLGASIAASLHTPT